MKNRHLAIVVKLDNNIEIWNTLKYDLVAKSQFYNFKIIDLFNNIKVIKY